MGQQNDRESPGQSVILIVSAISRRGPVKGVGETRAHGEPRMIGAVWDGYERKTSRRPAHGAMVIRLILHTAPASLSAMTAVKGMVVVLPSLRLPGMGTAVTQGARTSDRYHQPLSLSRCVTRRALRISRSLSRPQEA